MSETYLIIGASGGIGSELSRRLVRQGANVFFAVAMQRRFSRRRRTATADLGDGCQGLVTNEAAVQHAVERFGKLDGAVNLAGSVLLKPAT